MTGNLALFDPEAPAKILAAAQDDLDWGIAWTILKEGMHPEQIRRLRPDNLKGEWLVWKRVKNENPRQAFVPEADRERMTAFLKMLKPSKVTIWARAKAMTHRAGYDANPRELRHTAILNWLREYGDRHDALDLVAARAGCSKEVIARYYISLRQWEELGKPSEKVPSPRDGRDAPQRARSP